MPFQIIESATFTGWFSRLRDTSAKLKIDARIRSVAEGNLGDIRSVGEGVLEMRIHYGPGYRLYFIRNGPNIIVLLCGGDKSNQRRDIKRARQLAKEWSQA